MNTPGWMHPQLLAFNPLQADRRIVHFKWDTEWDTLWATTRIPPLLVLDCMGYKADLSVSFNSLENPASAGFLLSGVSHVPAINNPRMSRVFYSLKCVTMRKMVPLILPKE